MKEQDEAEKGESVIDGMHILVEVHVPGLVSSFPTSNDTD